jgi:hypothetical protein
VLLSYYTRQAHKENRTLLGFSRIFGEGCPKVFVIQVIMPLGNFGGIASENPLISTSYAG